MQDGFTRFLTSGRAVWLAWGLLLAGVGSLAWYAYGEHDRRMSAEAAGSSGLVLLQHREGELRELHHENDSLQTLLDQTISSQTTTLTDYEHYQQSEAARIAAGRRAAAALSADSLKRLLSNRYGAHPRAGSR